MAQLTCSRERLLGELMKQLAVEWQELMLAFDDSSLEANYYLDTETGQVLLVTDEAFRQLEELYDEHFDPEAPEAFDVEAALAEMDNLHDWQKEEVLEADFVEAHYGGRFIAIPETPSYEAYDEMQDFISTIQDDRLYRRLRDATQGRGAFRRFKDILWQHPAEQERWYAFQDNRLRERILEWLADHGIEPAEVPQPAAEDEEEKETPRPRLLDEVVVFVRAAGRIPGVTRIALIGSLTTDKRDPKDADLLVTVADDADLTPLATAGRKLQGHAQNFGRGGEVFLADPHGRYLGRTCPWKRCGPGIRASCDALHCGRRPYLHDDLREIKLVDELVAEPPLELWPQIVARTPVPDDVAERVLQPIQELLAEREK